MTLSIRNTLRSLSVLVLTAGFMPGCDNEDHEALGLSSEEIDAMSEEELDELAALEDDDGLGHSVSHKNLTDATHPGEPEPRPADLKTPASDATPGVQPLGHIADQNHPTHASSLDEIADQNHPTHTSSLDEIADQNHPTHTSSLDEIADQNHPTHASSLVVELGAVPVRDPGCKPHTVIPQLANG